jgi:hypothetical protein
MIQRLDTSVCFAWQFMHDTLAAAFAGEALQESGSAA